MGFGLRLGAKIDICGSGSGAVMLAFLDEQRRERILGASDATQQEVDRTRALFDPIRQRGYHVGPSPQVQGLTNISFPVFGVHDVIEAVITIPYLTLIPEAMHREVPSIDRCREQLGGAGRRPDTGYWRAPTNRYNELNVLCITALSITVFSITGR
ncbi:hypothetical protein HSBAA_22490 [Vreelandella sulfidaeris]|uniref:IclR-ED domain-containing protein n=1 Tax=Vreelandella sulfidaeris TaxID=115553 RepID=A0A455U6X5_9GAMM|nr:hypothetical protein HSBAA_22490 [Halomonas sulfidaeris]